MSKRICYPNACRANNFYRHFAIKLIVPSPYVRKQTISEFFN